MAHKLKGAAANLAVTDVAQCAGDIEHRIKSGANATASLRPLQDALLIARESIHRYAPAVQANSDAVVVLAPAQSEALSQLWPQLMQSLEADDLDGAETALDTLQTLVGPDALQLLRATLSDFDFKGACAAARLLGETLGVEGEG